MTSIAAAAATKATTPKTVNGKSTAAPGTSPHAPAAQKPAAAAGSPEDKKLLALVRGNAQRIVSALSYSASRAGDLQNWTEMQEMMALANKLSLTSGIAGTPPAKTVAPEAKPLAQAATAGR